MKDDLSIRMKEQYEHRTRYYLPRRTYTLVRLDGKAFHSYTKGFKRPFDEDLANMMNETAKYLCKEIQGVQFAYVQSDEISLLLTDFERITTDAWFDGNIQKICSVSAAYATAKFNQLAILNMFSPIDAGLTESMISEETYQPREKVINIEQIENLKLAQFDSRVWTMSDKVEVANYFIWRQQDAVRNSISMAAQSQYSHKELNGVNTSKMQDLLMEKGINWNDYSERFKRGGFISRIELESDIEIKGETKTVIRTKWATIPMPIFTQDRNFLLDKIPNIGENI